MDYKALIDLLIDHNVFIQTHNFPDPDAIASAFGLQRFLAYHGVPTKICYCGKVEKISTKRMLDIFDMDMATDEEVDRLTIDDYIVTIDGQKNNTNFTDLPGDEVACIDHHPTIHPYEYHYKDVRIVGACATLVTQYFVESNTPMEQDVATALLYGMHMDTDSFNRGVTDLDIEMFRFLNQRAEQSVLRNMRNSVMELEDLRAYGEAIHNVHIYDNVGFAMIPFECPEALVAMISDFILGLDVVEVAVVHDIRDGGLKYSVRSEIPYVHAGTLIRKSLEGIGDGGGHAAMAGGFVPKELVDRNKEHRLEYELRQRFLEEISRQKNEWCLEHE